MEYASCWSGRSAMDCSYAALRSDHVARVVPCCSQPQVAFVVVGGESDEAVELRFRFREAELAEVEPPEPVRPEPRCRNALDDRSQRRFGPFQIRCGLLGCGQGEVRAVQGRVQRERASGVAHGLAPFPRRRGERRERDEDGRVVVVERVGAVGRRPAHGRPRPGPASPRTSPGPPRPAARRPRRTPSPPRWPARTGRWPGRGPRRRGRAPGTRRPRSSTSAPRGRRCSLVSRTASARG